MSKKKKAIKPGKVVRLKTGNLVWLVESLFRADAGSPMQAILIREAAVDRGFSREQVDVCCLIRAKA